MNRVGLVEDNRDYRQELAFSLLRAGFQVVLESDGTDIDQQLLRHPCNLLVLDLGLPGEDGLSIARRLRVQQPQLGIVMLTARGAMDDRLTGFREGADAYLVKPVDMRELAGVLFSLQRRLGIAPSGEWRLLATKLRIETPDGLAVSLTARESALLRALAKNTPDPTTRRELAAAMGHHNLDYDYRRIEVAISRLRKKLEAAAPGNQLLCAVRAVGYVLGAPLDILN
jgi:two-component system response regulator PhoP